MNDGSKDFLSDGCREHLENLPEECLRDFLEQLEPGIWTRDQVHHLLQVLPRSEDGCVNLLDFILHPRCDALDAEPAVAEESDVAADVRLQELRLPDAEPAQPGVAAVACGVVEAEPAAVLPQGRLLLSVADSCDTADAEPALVEQTDAPSAMLHQERYLPGVVAAGDAANVEPAMTGESDTADAALHQEMILPDDAAARKLIEPAVCCESADKGPATAQESEVAAAPPPQERAETEIEPHVEIDFKQVLRDLPAGLRLPPYVGSCDNFLYDYAVLHHRHLCCLAAQARVLVHSRAMRLIELFIGVKLIAGSESERGLYRSMTPKSLILRLLFNRPAVFWQAEDSWCLKDGTEGAGGFERIGTKAEKRPLLLCDLLSYDEMHLSALLGVSVPTPFFNRGDRGNQGRQDGESYPFEGVYAGVVGARFEKPGYMEYAHMLVTPAQNTPKNGYGRDASNQRSHILRVWADFYGRSHLPTWQEALQAPAETYVRLSADMLLDREIYKARLRMCIEPFLLDADARGQLVKKMAYVHIVGLGLGVWALDNSKQANLMLEVYRDLLLEHQFDFVSTINFSWFPVDCRQDIVRHDRIRILFSKRDVAEAVGSEELLVAMYAWDSNSYPGNEYWLGALDASGDPAAACCSAISVLQNPEVNPCLREISSITILPQTEAKVSDVRTSKMSLHFKEPVQTRYLHVSDSNVLILLLPLVGGEEIGTDNTCQTVLELQRFFGKRFNSDELKDSACHVLQSYLRALKCDLRLLSMCGAALQGCPGHDTFWEKDARRVQVEAYIEMLKRHRYDLGSLEGSYPIFPSAVCDVIKRSSNLFCMLLSPHHVDDWLRLPEYTFQLVRSNEASFGGDLRQCFRLKLQQDGPPADPLLAHVFAKGLSKEDHPTVAKFTQMQQHLLEYLTMRSQPEPTFSYKSLEELTNALMVECDTMGELVLVYLSAEMITPPESQSLFSGVSNVEELTMMSQMFLGIASLHFHAYAASRLSLADVCEANSRECAQAVCKAAYALEPENALLEWAQAQLDAALPGDKLNLVKQRFRAFWTTVQHAPHLDEFLVHFSDLCTDRDCMGVSHQGCICVPFSQLERARTAEIEAVREAANQEFTNLRCALAEEGRHLRHENKRQVQCDPVAVDEDVLRRNVELASAQEAAEMLLMIQEDGTPLYRHFMCEGQAPLHHWNRVKVQLLSILEDQAELDSFSECLQRYERCARVWLRITGFFARSLYTEATATVPHALGQLASLSNDEQPYKLQRALQLLHVDIELGNIIMSEFYDGYSVYVSQEEKEMLLKIHTRRRRNFHLTPEMARLLYQLVERRYGRDSQAYAQMQSMDNAAMHALPDPRTMALRMRQQVDADVIRAPRKIFHACHLLDLVIPHWEFNHYSGYIVSADSAVIDQLESTIEWSRGLLAAGSGAPGTRAARRSRATAHASHSP